MSTRHALSMVIRRDRSAALLPKLCGVLAPRNARMLEGLVWEPASEETRPIWIGTTEVDARGIAGPDGLDMLQVESCLSLAVKLEPELSAALRPPGMPVVDGVTHFGCMWTDISAGAEYLLLEMVAATSDMSRVIEQSGNIRALWAGLARAVDAEVAYIRLDNTRDDRASCLYPARHADDLYLPDLDGIGFTSGCERYSIDRLACFVLRYNGLAADA